MGKINVLIIGAGPAGYTAAIYAARAGLKPVLYQGTQPGGQLSITNDVENYPGFPQSIAGPEMMELFKQQAQRFGTDVRTGTITKVDFNKELQCTADNETNLVCNAVIISTGASVKWLGIPSEKAFMGKGVTACAVCDGFFYKNQDVAVVGGGDTACEEASYLSKLCNKVYVLVRRNQMRASNIMQERVKNLDNIEILWNTNLVEIMGNQEVERIKYLNNKTNETQEIDLQGVFMAIGHQPNTHIFKNIIDMDKDGYILTKADSTQTNIEGVFAVGDVQDKKYRQAVTAAGTGCMGALEAEQYLVQQKTKMQTA